MVINQFNELEMKIEHLIETCKRLEDEKSNLIQKNQELNLQLQEKINTGNITSLKNWSDPKLTV